MKPIRDDLQFLSRIYHLEVWNWKISVDGKSGRSVFKLAIFGPFIAKEAISKDRETIIGASDTSFFVGLWPAFKDVLLHYIRCRRR
jgi:hypothetical protein